MNPLIEGVKLLCALFVALALVSIVAIGGGVCIPLGGIFAGLAAVFIPQRGRRTRA
jgi:hypothetical protein